MFIESLSSKLSDILNINSEAFVPSNDSLKFSLSLIITSFIAINNPGKLDSHSSEGIPLLSLKAIYDSCAATILAYCSAYITSLSILPARPANFCIFFSRYKITLSYKNLFYFVDRNYSLMKV